MFAAFILAFLMAMAFMAIFSYAFKIRGPWGSAWTMFLILFLSMWAVSLWIRPVGPDLGGVFWVPALLVGLLIVLLLSAVPSTRGTQRTAEGPDELLPEEKKGVAAMGFFFWGLLIVLLIIILIAHL